jgi:hypothetical protein
MLKLQVNSSKYQNGHDWLERKLTANGTGFTKHDHVFLWILESKSWQHPYVSEILLFPNSFLKIHGDLTFILCPEL